MNPRPASPSAARAADDAGLLRIGCVSYLNAKPLIDGMENQPDAPVRFDVPSGLLDDLLADRVRIALCPVIDFFRSETPLEIVPVGGIGCDGPTLTVRIFSRKPIPQTAEIFADTDSHTSVALMRVLLRELHGLTPRVVDFNAREGVAENRLNPRPDTMLLIGDKVVTAAPDEREYPHQIDLGQAWKELTGLPFVFAVWMCRAGAELGDLPARLDAQRRFNAQRIPRIVERHHAAHGWPRDLAQRYLGEFLRFAVGERELGAIARFGALAAKTGVIPADRAIALRR